MYTCLTNISSAERFVPWTTSGNQRHFPFLNLERLFSQLVNKCSDKSYSNWLMRLYSWQALTPICRPTCSLTTTRWSCRSRSPGWSMTSPSRASSTAVSGLVDVNIKPLYLSQIFTLPILNEKKNARMTLFLDECQGRVYQDCHNVTSKQYLPITC